MAKQRTRAHIRIKILDWGGDGWRWYCDRGRIAEFRSAAAAPEILETLKALNREKQGTAEMVCIPAGAENPDEFLGNIKD